MRLGDEIHRAEVRRGGRVRVRGVGEGVLKDFKSGQAQVEFKWWFLKWSRWYPVSQIELPDSPLN